MADGLCRFGPFVLDARREELRRDGETIHLTPKVYALLVYLVAHSQRLVPKEELLDAVWADTHVAEGSLARTMTSLRQALGDPASGPLYIETVARRGYRFIAAVEELEHAPEAEESSYCLVHERRVYRLRRGQNILGRDDDSAVPIASFAVSRRHAAIVVTADGATIADLRSKNGTTVAGKRVTEPVPLREGNEIRLGPLVFLFTSCPEARSTVTEIREL